ncbi:hypothetical protein BO83DRAFT_462672 [Aspergillus eucalypticola CBS 122712]|uniref:Uncharacterized protein n=1 Tax=Aspergillus eucalypticola (strain CBS 122712 / IBT 29274) TaxID=1448314 RepID=A0A317VUN5_ASPEC|nr:uncharacterized protein BO83DRAFT_462672 [Aspergillus eucalypticola CBS 122712]PWY76737.1 hypothetical protein BO83DRAFT_462672 [Aspergillus eucalypticola CBS 122712]
MGTYGRVIREEWCGRQTVRQRGIKQKQSGSETIKKGEEKLKKISLRGRSYIVGRRRGGPSELPGEESGQPPFVTAGRLMIAPWPLRGFHFQAPRQGHAWLGWSCPENFIPNNSLLVVTWLNLPSFCILRLCARYSIITAAFSPANFHPPIIVCPPPVQQYHWAGSGGFLGVMEIAESVTRHRPTHCVRPVLILVGSILLNEGEDSRNFAINNSNNSVYPRGYGMLGPGAELMLLPWSWMYEVIHSPSTLYSKPSWLHRQPVNR